MRTIFFIFITISLLYAFLSNGKKLPHKDFDSSIGGEKKIESLILTRFDKRIYAHYKDIYEKNSLHAGENIPKNIHFLSLSSQLSKKEKKSISSFLKKHPGWKFICWSDKLKTDLAGVELHPIKGFLEEPFYIRFKASKNKDEKKLILALQILEKYGGIVIDLPAKCVQSLEGLLEGQNFFLGLNPLEEPLFGTPLKLSFSLMGSSKENPLLKRIFRNIETALESLYIEESLQDRAKGYHFHYCYYQPFENALLEEEGGIALYPPGYFQPDPSGFSAFVLPGKKETAANATFERKLNDQFKKIEKTQKIIFIMYAIILFVFISIFIKKLFIPTVIQKSVLGNAKADGISRS